MYLKEFEKLTGLTSGQIRRLCDKGLIPFDQPKGSRRRYNQESINAVKSLFEPVSERVFIGPSTASCSRSEVRILDYIKLTPRNAVTFIPQLREYFKKRRVASVRVALGFHMSDVSIAIEICNFCLNNNISFEYLRDE